MESSSLKDIGHLTKFNGSNFPRWKCGLRLILEQHGLLDIIDGVELKPAEVILYSRPNLFYEPKTTTHLKLKHILYCKLK